MAQIQFLILNEYLGFGYKGIVFCRNNGKNGQETHSTKMGADSSVKNTPNAPEFICPNCLLKPQSSGFQLERFHWASVVPD